MIGLVVFTIIAGVAAVIVVAGLIDAGARLGDWMRAGDTPEGVVAVGDSVQGVPMHAAEVPAHEPHVESLPGEGSMVSLSCEGFGCDGWAVVTSRRDGGVAEAWRQHVMTSSR